MRIDTIRVLSAFAVAPKKTNIFKVYTSETPGGWRAVREINIEINRSIDREREREREREK